MPLAFIAVTLATATRGPSRRAVRLGRSGARGPKNDGGLGEAYSRRALRFAPEATLSLSSEAQDVLRRGRCHLTPEAQARVLEALMRSYLGSDRSVRSVAVRDALADVVPGVDWRASRRDMEPACALVFDAALRLASAVEVQVGYVPGRRAPRDLVRPMRPEPTRGVLVPRSWLELPEYDLRNLYVGHYVELLAAEEPEPADPVRFDAAERVYAVVEGASMRDGSPRLRVLDRFQNRDVRPRFADRHGLYAGRVVECRPVPPTGIRRVYATTVT